MISCCGFILASEIVIMAGSLINLFLYMYLSLQGPYKHIEINLCSEDVGESE